MNARERYYWDLTGHLVVPGVLPEREVDDINRTLDYLIDSGAVSESEGGSRNSTFLQGGKTWWSFANLLDLPGDYASPIRRLLVHPEVVVRLRTMCGPGFRLDHGPQFQNARKGAEGLTLHGAGAPHRDFVAYHNQAGEMYCGGVTVTWNLTDCPAGGGGFAAAIGSHKLDFPMPLGVRNCDDDGGAVVQPEVKAGDALFFMDGAQTHGTHPWQNDHERRSILLKYASRTSARSGVSRQLYPPNIYWDANIVEEMTPAQRAVIAGPGWNFRSDPTLSLTVEEDGRVVTDAESAH
ncbi:MAG: hypothetical protein CME26_05350 [Gemmatimonadetes bacterium]|nr:hypothetical protein [Gemmatimonadota bacterium]|tara:strand:+ start:43 stop:924 length:882 start_codon:yes stop_codon:yes gene_type:complete